MDQPLGNHGWPSAPHFDELHVISDLHFGGEHPGAQIFGSTAELSWLVDHLAAADPKRQIALAINGDFIDFLAELPSVYFDPMGAIAKLNRIMGDPSFAPVFAALTRFVSTPERTLIINLGNHDVELALPWVRERLIDAICPDAPARARLRVVSDGTGVFCNVGGAKVLLAHGNEVDSWNVTDFERIRRIARDISFGKAVEPWVPNAGTQMVIDVMNGIKRQFAFVDLLKPEAGAVVPTLLALDPSAVTKIAGFAGAAARRGRDAARMVTGFLGDAPEDTAFAATPHGFEPSVYAESTLSRRTTADSRQEQLMERIEQELKKGTAPLDLVQSPGDAQLGGWAAAWNVVRGRPAHESLREMLEALDKDRSFDTAVADDTSRGLDALVAPNVDFVIAGHTHLERALPRKAGHGYYFNSGTWARLIRITPEARQDPVQFQRLFKVLQGGMQALDGEPGLVTKRCSVVSIVSQPIGGVLGELRRVSSTAAVFSLKPVPDTQCTQI